MMDKMEDHQHTELELRRRREIVEIASSMLTGHTDLMVGMREIVRLRKDLRDSMNPIFYPIIAVESETDTLPVGSQRTKYKPNELKELDADLNAYLDEVREDVLLSCKAIITEFSSPNQNGLE
jgi:hypothetical protein